MTTWPTLPDGRYAVLRTHRADGTSYGGFQWPTEVGGIATAPDWDPNPGLACGAGLHGLLWGCGDAGLLTTDGAWLVVAVDPADIATPLDGERTPSKIRFRSAEILHVGDMSSATAWIVANGGHGLPVVHSTATAGDRGTAAAGYYGTATAGYSGTATAGYSGTATAGDRGTATAGDRGTAAAGDRGTATAGYRGTATAGYYGTATAGEDGVLSITFYDESTRRYRRRIGEIDGVTLLPNVAYRLNAAGEFVAVQS